MVRLVSISIFAFHLGAHARAAWARCWARAFRSCARSALVLIRQAAEASVVESCCLLLFVVRPCPFSPAVNFFACVSNGLGSDDLRLYDLHSRHRLPVRRHDPRLDRGRVLAKRHSSKDVRWKEKEEEEEAITERKALERRRHGNRQQTRNDGPYCGDPTAALLCCLPGRITRSHVTYDVFGLK